jgi:hypothetical protein
MIMRIWKLKGKYEMGWSAFGGVWRCSLRLSQPNPTKTKPTPAFYSISEFTSIP